MRTYLTRSSRRMPLRRRSMLPELISRAIARPRHRSPPSADDRSRAGLTGKSPRLHGAHAKLPKLAIRPFNGDITHWTTFWDSFESAIDSSPGLSAIDKFNYLKSLLEKSAAEAISGLTLSADNYKEAVSILKKRFGNKQQIISKHMDILLKLEAVPSQHNLKGLHHLYDSVESQVRGLKSLEVEPSSYGSLLSSVLLQKLPPDLRLVVSREISEEDWSLDALLKQLEREIEARERAMTSSSQSTKRPGKDSSIGTAATLLSPNSAPTCCYCRQAHTSSSCRAVADVEERKQILRRSGRCFVCLKRYHISRECRSKVKCPKCGGKHHASICLKGSPRKDKAPPSSNSPPPSSEADQSTVTRQSGLNPQASEYSPITTNSMYTSADTAVLLQTARAQICNPDKPQISMEVRVILDSGSQRSYVTHDIKNALSLNTQRKQRMSIKTFGAEREEEHECDVVSIGMKTVNGECLELSLFTVPLICEPLTNQPVAFCKAEYGHLAQLQLAEFCDGGEEMAIDILIGSDHYWKLATGETVQGERGPTAIHTKLGWVLSGPTDAIGPHVSAVNVVTSHALRIDAQPQSAEALDTTLKMFWELESLGITRDSAAVLEDFNNEIAFKDGRYQVSLPWKEAHPVLSDNYHHSEKRLRGLLHRLKQNPPVLKEYDRTIRDQLSKGIVEQVDKVEGSTTGDTHYIPHHAVIRQDKQTTKLRVVYDASAKADGTSLNDCLYTGPKFGQNIMDIVLRFRVHKVALSADIEKAFLMVAVSEKDRDVLRFLWVDDITKDEPDIIALRFTRVMFGVSSSPFLLNATISHHLRKYSSTHSEVVQRISRSLYVDDIAYGANTEDLAYELYADSKAMLKEGGFNLRKFVTNSDVLQKKIDDNESLLQSSPVKLGHDSTEDESYTKATLGTTQQISAGETKVLGVKWNPATDCLVFDFSEVASQVVDPEPTKRHVVGVASRFYDPIGFMSPVTIRFKILFQELCGAKLGWDERLPSETLRRWQTLVSSLQRAQPMSIPRHYFWSLSQTASTCSLQGFCDASKSAYAAVVYLSVDSSPGQPCRRFIACKTRVAPLKEQTIPRLELLSALLLSKLMASVSQALETELHLGQPSYFTDSKVALYWIRGQDKEWKPFVQNRVNQIRSMTLADQWKHCPGAKNPADLPSRGINPHQLADCSLWQYGPDWVHDSTSPSEVNELTVMPEECKSEKKKSEKAHGLLNATRQAKSGMLIKCEDFSSKGRLLRVTAYVLKYIKLLRQRSKSSNEEITKNLTATDLQEAETYWIREMQASFEANPKFKTWQQQFGLFVDDSGVWRCGGRLANAEIPYTAKHPVLLDPQHPLTTLIVQDAHSRVKHDGVRETLTELRSRYWIVHGRSFVRKVVHRCVVCRRFEGRSLHPPPPPPLPTFRVNQAPAFTYTGVDYAGPLYIKEAGRTENTKVWICLYTCCVVRAIHLEVVPDLTTQSFIRSFKRFAARRGFPAKMISDNAKTFKSAAKVLSDMVKHPEVEEYLAGNSIQWSFNLEKAPWWGGIFERMVRSVKRCLRKTIGRGQLVMDELTTAVTEVEMIVNSRPLTYFSTEDVAEPVTPSHLITGRRLMSLPDGPYNRDIDDSVGTNHSNLTKRMIHLSTVMEHFWRRWKGEYLSELRESHRQVKPGSRSGVTQPISIGDIVLVHDADHPRGFWKLARVEGVIIGSDGQARGATIKIHSSGKRTTLLRRPLQLLYPLEVHSSSDTNSDDTSDIRTTEGSNMANTDQSHHHETSTNDPEMEASRVGRRSQRMAARNAREIIRIQTEDS